VASSLLAERTSSGVRELLSTGRAVALVPVGSVEPHGPHLPLGTDTLLGEETARRAVEALAAQGVEALVAPSVPYGVTDFAEGFAGAVSIAAPALVAYLDAVTKGLLAAGFAHVCWVSNHLEPAHDEAVRAAAAPFGPRASVASPLTRRHARTLSAEYKSGACHAGRYETSLVLAARPDLVNESERSALPAKTESLAEGIRRGITRFSDLGMDRAYTGAPAEATTEEGHELYARLVAMVVLEVTEALAVLAPPASTHQEQTP
jgi:creatinine amidohydrolase